MARGATCVYELCESCDKYGECDYDVCPKCFAPVCPGLSACDICDGGFDE
jgi:hypothetical protein